MASPTEPPKSAFVTHSELIQLIQFCRKLFSDHRLIDYYATTVGIGMIMILGILGNAGTLLTLSGRRMTTQTFLYYRAIAFTDLIRCLFVFSYILRVVVPFREYYAATWYEAHLLYFLINALSFVSTCLAVTLCVRLCIGILQSRRLQKTNTNPKMTKILIGGIVLASVLVNCCLGFEYEVTKAVDYCSRNRSIYSNEYMIQLTNFHSEHIGLLTAIQLLPTIILLILLCGAAVILAYCLYTMPRKNRNQSSPSTSIPLTRFPSRSSSSTNALLLHHCPSVQSSRPWRNQRQLCLLFLLLTFCYGVGLLPELFNLIMFSKMGSCPKCTSKLENYRTLIKRHFDRENFATISNIFQNIGHALSFYVYLLCSEAFRSEFLVKLRRLGLSRFYTSIFPYTRILGCANLNCGGTGIEKMSQSSETKPGLPNVSTILGKLDSELEFTAQENVIEQEGDQVALEMFELERTFGAAAVSYTDAPVFTLAALARRWSGQLQNRLDATVTVQMENWGGSENKADDEKDTRTVEMPMSPVQLSPERYQRFYSDDRRKRGY